MKHLKKLTALLLCCVLAVGSCVMLSGCAKGKAQSFDIVLITDGGAVTDKGYNQSAWSGVQEYAGESGASCRYFQPYLDENGKLSDEIIAKYIELAANSGAKQIVLPGKAFAISAYELAPTYKDIQFVLVDAFPHSRDDKTMRMIDNVMSVRFNAYEAGFLAGFTAVLKGNTKLGYLGDVQNERSADYGEGFVQGAGYAADANGKPVYVDFANYNAKKLDYDYSFTVRPVYIKTDEAKKETFKVNVVDGIGSGVYTDGENVTVTANPAPQGKAFDHWETKSDTEGVKDKKVNISSKKDASMNLLVGDCDCTITAVWKDADTASITVKASDAEPLVYYAPKDSEYWVEAPAAPSGQVFDHWESSAADAVKDVNAKGTTVYVGTSDIQLTPVYVKSELPTFDVRVENGTGSGSYLAGDTVKVVANAPAEGYMFYKWENVDNQGLSTGIAMTNEYCYHTEFEMVNRYASVVEKMFDDGTQVVFGGGCDVSDSIFEATGNFDYPVYGFGCGIDESGKGTCLASVINDYGAAVKQCLGAFKGAGIFDANCKSGCIYVTGMSTDKENKDEYDEQYAAAYNIFASGKTLRSSGAFSCLTVKYWIKK